MAGCHPGGNKPLFGILITKIYNELMENKHTYQCMFTTHPYIWQCVDRARPLTKLGVAEQGWYRGGCPVGLPDIRRRSLPWQIEHCCLPMTLLMLHNSPWSALMRRGFCCQRSIYTKHWFISKRNIDIYKTPSHICHYQIASAKYEIFDHIIICIILVTHDDVIKWKHFSRYWPFVRGIHRSPMNLWSSSHKGQSRRFLLLYLIFVCANCWAAGGLRRYSVHYDVTVMHLKWFVWRGFSPEHI